MKRSLQTLGFTGMAMLIAALPLAADNGSGQMGHFRHGFGIQKCLAVADLTPDEQTAVDAILASGKTTLQADGQTLKADHQKLKTDLTNNADKSVIGQDTINLHTDAAKFKSDAQAIRDQILAKLQPDQQNKVSGCLEASHHRHSSAQGNPGSSS